MVITLDSKETDNKSRIFPKKVGVIFLIGEGEYGKQSFKPFNKKALFNPVACAHLLLQLNAIQNFLTFQIISLNRGPLRGAKIPRPTSKNDGNLLPAFSDLIDGIEIITMDKWADINYWIGITTMNINTNIESRSPARGSLYEIQSDENTKGETRHISIITSSEWEKKFSPPSLFEYFVFTSFMCGLNFISREYKYEIEGHRPSGCIFDFTYERLYYRIAMSDPHICSICKHKLLTLEKKIKKIYPDVTLYDEVNNVLSTKWLGSPEERNTPLYTLKRNYRYDVDRNSGFNKSWKEKFLDNIFEHVPEWTVGTVIVGVITGILIILGFKS